MSNPFIHAVPNTGAMEWLGFHEQRILAHLHYRGVSVQPYSGRLAAIGLRERETAG